MSSSSSLFSNLASDAGSPASSVPVKRGVVLVREANWGSWVQKVLEFDPSEAVLKLIDPTTNKTDLEARISNRKDFKVKPSPYLIPQYPDALALHLYPLSPVGEAVESDSGTELHVASINKRDILDWSYFFRDWLNQPDRVIAPCATNDLSLVADLTDEEERLATVLLSKSSKRHRPDDPGESTVLIEKFNIEVSRKTLSCLRPLEWLSDEVVNFYFSLIQSENDGVFCWNSFFYTKLSSGGYNYSGVRNWAAKRGIDWFDGNIDIMLIPLHISDQAHWAVGVVDLKHKTTTYLDSLGAENPIFHTVILNYLDDESRTRKPGKAKFDRDSWSARGAPMNLSLQTNGSDCGVFICMYALAIARGKDVSCVTPESVEPMRKRIAIDIVSGRISR